MKQGRKLTRNQRKYLASIGLQPESWLLCKNVNGIWTLEHRWTYEIKEVEGMK